MIRHILYFSKTLIFWRLMCHTSRGSGKFMQLKGLSIQWTRVIINIVLFFPSLSFLSNQYLQQPLLLRPLVQHLQYEWKCIPKLLPDEHHRAAQQPVRLVGRSVPGPTLDGYWSSFSGCSFGTYHYISP